MRHHFLLLLAFFALATSACRQAGDAPAKALPESPAPQLLALGPQATCVTGDAVTCAGDQTFQIPAEKSALARAGVIGFGLRHGCMIDEAGKTKCWGDATQGQLGYDTKPAGSAVSKQCRGRDCEQTPKPLEGAPPLESIAAGWLHTCGLVHGGSVFCWGDDTLHQLGRQSAGPAPAAVEGLEGNVAQLAAGGYHTCALLTGDTAAGGTAAGGTAGGKVACWGDGSCGQLGHGAGTDQALPVLVEGLDGKVVEIAAGGYHSCARYEDGGIACWGENRFGQLGDGTRKSSNSALRVQGLAAKARSLAVGFSFSCALLENNEVHCWGSDELGELGGGNAAPSTKAANPALPPTQVLLGQSSGQKVVSLVAGGTHACAQMQDGNIECWGANEFGQLGDGTLLDQRSPVLWQGKQAPSVRQAKARATPGQLQGLDVSYHSGRVDWPAAHAQGHHFGVTLATAGVDFLDPFFTSHWERMGQTGLVRGAYHFFVPADDPKEQARLFLSHVVFEPGDLRPVVDIETRGTNAPADLPARLHAFLDEVEAAVGVKAIIYTGPAFWNQNMNAEFGDYPLWIAEYGVPEPKIPKGWLRWHLWQWQGDDVTKPEIAPTLDLDRLHPDVGVEELLIP